MVKLVEFVDVMPRDRLEWFYLMGILQILRSLPKERKLEIIADHILVFEKEIKGELSLV
jgi:hypothetical protein